MCSYVYSNLVFTHSDRAIADQHKQWLRHYPPANYYLYDNSLIYRHFFTEKFVNTESEPPPVSTDHPI